jgi:copper transport protein
MIRTVPIFATLLLLSLAAAPSVAARNVHLALTSSEPAARATLTASPERLILRFTESPRLKLSLLTLTSAAGDTIPLGEVGRTGGDELTMEASVQRMLPPGNYTIRWTATGNDGHPISGTIPFSVAAGALPVPDPDAPTSSADTPQIPGATATDDPDHEHHEMGEASAGVSAPLSIWQVLARWLWLAPIVLIIGAVVFERMVLARAAAASLLPRYSARAATIGMAAAAIALLAAALRLVAQSTAVFGPEGALDGAAIGALFTETGWGAGWGVYVVTAIVAALGFAMARQGRRAGWALATFAAIGIAIAPALTGHAVANPSAAPLFVVLDAAHVLGAGSWVGTLVLLAAVGIPLALSLPNGSRAAEAAALVRAFSPVALFAAALTAATGIATVLLRIPAPSALWEERYGQTLLIKLALVGIMAAIGAYNWKRVTPHMTDDAGVARMRRSAWTEISVGVLVLAVTAILIMTPPFMR